MDNVIEALLNGCTHKSVFDIISVTKNLVLSSNFRNVLRSQVTRLWNLIINIDEQDDWTPKICAYGRELCYLAMKALLSEDSKLIGDENILNLMQMAARCERSFSIIQSREWVQYGADVLHVSRIIIKMVLRRLRYSMRTYLVRF